LDDGKSHNDKEESMSLKNEDTKVIGSLIFAKIEDGIVREREIFNIRVCRLTHFVFSS
jgi:hypothetical protein